MTRTLSIIIPVYNEEATIGAILNKIAGVELVPHLTKEIIVVNDGSTDGTHQAIAQVMKENSGWALRYTSHAANLGKGAAVKTALGLATGAYIIVQDADMEYDPSEYNLLLEPMLAGHADVVYGSRFVGSKPHRVLYFWHYAGNRFLTFLSNLFTNLNLTDMESCYKLFRREIIQDIALREKRFGFEPEITAKVARIPGVRIYEVGISYYGRTYLEGKKINWRDGVWAIWCILKYNLNNRRL
ncbi:MAG: glycosyltransferase family 2 protein [Saprospiraceae bacterium]|nr:glycosyltransferase family 2 protein [Saprospiraceae bacterium]